MTKNRIINIIKMSLGSVLYSAGICSFLNPADIAPGGASGTSIILNHLFGLPIGIMSILINVS